MKNGPILIIEDDKDDCDFIKGCLEAIAAENELLCFDNGKDGLEYLEKTKEHPFLILCDINMPRMNGLELRTVINETKYLRDKSIPFIFFSTTAAPNEVKRAYDLTVQGFFVKPRDMSEMEQLLKKIVIYWRSCKHPNNLNN